MDPNWTRVFCGSRPPQRHRRSITRAPTWKRSHSARLRACRGFDPRHSPHQSSFHSEPSWRSCFRLRTLPNHEEPDRAVRGPSKSRNERSCSSFGITCAYTRSASRPPRTNPRSGPKSRSEGTLPLTRQQMSPPPAVTARCTLLPHFSMLLVQLGVIARVSTSCRPEGLHVRSHAGWRWKATRPASRSIRAP